MFKNILIKNDVVKDYSWMYPAIELDMKVPNEVMIH